MLKVPPGGYGGAGGYPILFMRWLNKEGKKGRQIDNTDRYTKRKDEEKENLKKNGHGGAGGYSDIHCRFLNWQTFHKMPQRSIECERESKRERERKIKREKVQLYSSPINIKTSFLYSSSLTNVT